MSIGYELFHANHIQYAARRRLHRLYRVMAGLLLVTLSSLTLEWFGPLPMTTTAWILGGTWLLGIGITGWQLERVRRKVWCIKVATDAIVGYDHARRQMRLTWTAIRRIDLTDDALIVMKSPRCFFEVSTTFPEYATLSHRIIRYANRHGAAVYVDGQPWHELDVYALYPFLATEPPADASDLTA